MNKRLLTFLSLIVALILACNFPSFAATNVIPTETASPIAQSGSGPVATVPPVAGSTIPFASPNGQPLNCRSGPGTDWPVVIVLNVGQAVEIVGKSLDGLWWYVKNPILPGTFCWIAMSYTITTGNTSGVLVVAATQAGPTSGPGSSSAGIVTSVDVSLSKDEIFVAGCMGPIQPITVYGKIQTNGAVTIEWHFKDDQSGNLSSHSLKFKRADIQDVSESFTPLVNAGKHKITLVINGMNLKGMNSAVSYKISC